MSASAISISTYPLLWLAILLGGWAVFKTPVYFFQIDQRRVDVLCDHDQKVPTKDFVRPSQHNDKKPLRACSDTLSYAITCL